MNGESSKEEAIQGSRGEWESGMAVFMNGPGRCSFEPCGVEADGDLPLQE